MSKRVTSTETVSFPQFNWGIRKGEELELPADEAAQAAILASEYITEVGKKSEAKEIKSIAK